MAASVGQSDPITVTWKVKGKATLLVHDINYPSTPANSLAPVGLLLTHNGKTDSFLLSANDTLRLPLGSESDSLTIRKQPDNIVDDRLRYLELVASKWGKDSFRVIQVAIRPDSASDEIGFRVSGGGDTLVAEGVNNAARWGNDFNILTVSNGSNRELIVTHAGISRVLHPGDPPADDFSGTPVGGFWSLKSPLTQNEKNNPGFAPPPGLKIHITIIHH
jgi:hypothetical protein